MADKVYDHVLYEVPPGHFVWACPDGLHVWQTEGDVTVIPYYAQGVTPDTQKEVEDAK